MVYTVHACMYTTLTCYIYIYVCVCVARSSKGSVSTDSSASLTDDGQNDAAKIKKVKKSKKEKELKSPVELQPPLGPLVALGRPRDKLKRPR